VTILFNLASQDPLDILVFCSIEMEPLCMIEPKEKSVVVEEFEGRDATYKSITIESYKITYGAK